jgi:hypothetical protein
MMLQMSEIELKTTTYSPIISWEIFSRADRSAVLLYNFRREETSLQLLDSVDLAPLKRCVYDPYQRVTSVSDQFFASLSPGPASDPLLRKVTVSQVCGNELYQYNWHGDPTAAFLVGDDGLLLAGSSTNIEFRRSQGTKVLWRDSFDKHHDQVANHIETSADGKILVVAVKTFGGGNGRLDISQHLKAERLAIYDSSSGERIRVISVTPIAPSIFGFSVAVDGRNLAYLADGVVEIVSIP